MYNNVFVFGLTYVTDIQNLRIVIIVLSFLIVVNFNL